MMSFPGIAISAALCAWATLSNAQAIAIPIGEQGSTSGSLPHAGQTRVNVLEGFGLPDEEHSPVGKPPIQRWDYRTFSVYFENDRVVNSVRHHQPRLQKEE